MRLRAVLLVFSPEQPVGAPQAMLGSRWSYTVAVAVQMDAKSGALDGRRPGVSRAASGGSHGRMESNDSVSEGVVAAG